MFLEYIQVTGEFRADYTMGLPVQEKANFHLLLSKTDPDLVYFGIYIYKEFENVKNTF
jgi:succinate dehydrogenase flavin-adding protein (antitoxin of CptAB toxin-antitoxin module)